MENSPKNSMVPNMTKQWGGRHPIREVLRQGQLTQNTKRQATVSGSRMLAMSVYRRFVASLAGRGRHHSAARVVKVSMTERCRDGSSVSAMRRCGAEYGDYWGRPV